MIDTKKSIKSSVVGEWKSESYPFNKWESDVIAIPFLDNQELRISLKVSAHDEAIELAPSADNVMQAFLNKDFEDRNELSQIVYDQCQSFFEMTGFDHEAIELSRQFYDPEPLALVELLDLEDVNDVWKYTRAYGIYVLETSDREVYVQISFHCDWDEEHGLDLVFKNGVDFAGTENMF